MGEVLQKDLRDRQPENSVGHAAKQIRAAVQGVESRARPFCAVLSGVVKGVDGDETVFVQLPLDLRLREIELVEVPAAFRPFPACPPERPVCTPPEQGAEVGHAQQQYAHVFRYSPYFQQYATHAVPVVLDHAKGDVCAQTAVFKIEGPRVPDGDVDRGFRFLDPCDELAREIHANDPVSR